MGAQRQRRWTSQLKKRENPPSPLLSFCLGPQQIKWCLPTLLRMVFTQATASNANISESFTEALRNHVLPGVWASLSPVKLIHKINHLRIQKVLKSYRNQIPYGSLWVSLLSLFCVLGWKVRLLIWCVCVCAHSIMSDSVTPGTVTHQAPLSMEFSRQEYLGGLTFPPPGDLPDPGIESTSLASPALAGRFFTTAPSGKPLNWFFFFKYRCLRL